MNSRKIKEWLDYLVFGKIKNTRNGILKLKTILSETFSLHQKIIREVSKKKISIYI